jgi:hypothetical protein
MDIHIDSGTMIYRRMEQEGGLHESAHPFQTLEEMFALTLNAKDPYLVDRIIIHGQDQDGSQRIVTFVFQSITLSHQP